MTEETGTLQVTMAIKPVKIVVHLEDGTLLNFEPIVSPAEDPRAWPFRLDVAGAVAREEDGNVSIAFLNEPLSNVQLRFAVGGEKK